MNSPQTIAVALPRVAITYCTQCRWMLRAAYFGQELLSTFGTQIGEIALLPATGGLFSVELTYNAATSTAEINPVDIKKVLLWDRKAEGGFPETKVLKQRLRDFIDPSRDLGHSDKHGKKKEEKTDELKGEEKAVVPASGEEQKESGKEEVKEEAVKRNPDGTVCEDCR